MKKFYLSLVLSMAAIFAFAEDVKYKGDINADGEISLSDMVALASDMLNNVAYDSTHDLNSDGKIDDNDLQVLADIILNNIKKPQSGLDVGIGDWGDGGEWGGPVGARKRAAAVGNLFSITEIKQSGNNYYFDINVVGQNGTIYCGAIINIKLPENVNYLLDGTTPVVECNADGSIAATHSLYGKPTLQEDGSLRFIVFSNQLTDFSQATGAIARVYVTSRQREGNVTILPSELATSGDKGIGSSTVTSEDTPIDLVTISKYKITYVVDGVTYKEVEIVYGETIIPEAAPEKNGYIFSGWSEIPETMPAEDITVTGSFTLIDAIDDIMLSYKTVTVYGLNGVKLYDKVYAKDVLHKLPKGIYIIDGRKIYIK